VPILGYAEMLEPQIKPDTKSAQHIDEIRRAAERGRDLIDNILTFGRRDTRLQPVHVRTLFAEAASLLKASLPPGIELAFADVPATSPLPASRHSCSKSSSIYATTRPKPWTAAEQSA